MKKTILAVAGLAAVAGVAAPVAGVFADGLTAGSVTTHTDNISVTIGSVCTLGTVTSGTAYVEDKTTHVGAISGTNSHLGTWGDSNDTLSASSLVAGSTEGTLGTSTFTVKCNSNTGYKITAVGAGTADHKTELYKAAVTASGDTPAQAAASIATGTSFGQGKNATDGASYWGFSFGAGTNGMTVETGYDAVSVIPSSETTVAKKTTAGNLNGGETLTVTYKIGVSASQAAGTYTGAVTYALAAL